jgi:hypothetical protein
LDIDQSIILKDWLSFEENYSSFDSFQSAFTYCFPLMIPALTVSSASSSYTAAASTSYLTTTNQVEAASNSNNSYSSSLTDSRQQQGGKQQNKGVTVSYNDKKKGNNNKRSHQETIEEEMTGGDDKKKKRKVQFDDSKILTLEIDNQLPPAVISSSLSSASSSAPSAATVMSAPSRAAPVMIPQPTFSKETSSSSTAPPVLNTAVSSASSSSSSVSNDSSEIKTNIVQFRNLPFSVSLIEVSTFFQNLQSFSKIEMIYTKAGNFRGMINIEYSSKEEVEKMMELIKQKEEGSIVFQGRSLEMERNIASLENINPLIFRTVFINHLPSAATETELEELFSSCGKVEAVHIAKDKRTQQLKVRLISFSISLFS